MDGLGSNSVVEAEQRKGGVCGPNEARETGGGSVATQSSVDLSVSCFKGHWKPLMYYNKAWGGRQMI